MHNVLIVDDDRITLELLQLILEECVEGHIIAASSGTEAIDFVNANDLNHLSLIICDWNMPENDGLEVLKALRKKNRQLPFLMVTGNPTRQLVISARKAGATDFIAIPFKNYDLTEKVSNLLN
ncbi:response regulator [Aliiglaciecola sp. LCG003]|uniref:response regulator n=1 Tax=Aliiglaciecola sp. LCG003 TaxID=3053655 RepID=UPI0025739F80|nr:response regulator [Aliiglaciecola sp. LCG003]WJG10140.1 response regulator [Aliiglaciecola sp. LCG003]